MICGLGDSNPITADFVGYFENLEAGLGTVASRIDDNRVRRLPHVMKAENRKPRSYSEFYDDKLKDLVY